MKAFYMSLGIADVGVLVCLEVLTPATIEAYELHHCGNDEDVNTDWNANTATYDASHGNFPDWWKDEIIEGAGIWNDQSGANFSLHHYTGSSHDWTKRTEPWNPRIAETILDWVEAGTCHLTDTDVWYNTRYDFVECSDCDGNEYDVRSDAMHEFGHFLVLDDIPWWQLIRIGCAMYEKQSQDHTLYNDDKNGIQFLYGKD